MNARGLLLLGLGLLLVAAPARSQTRFSLAGGLLVPLGDLGDTTDPSPRFAVRGEFQTVNALGQRSPLSVFLQVSYSDLSLSSEDEATLASLGEDTGAYLLDAGAGIRVYSRAAPFFLTGGAGYVRFHPGGAGDALDGVDLNGGLGFAVPLSTVTLEVLTALHEVLVEEGRDFQYLDASLSVALPF